jgi:hypothetical protein
MTWRDTIKVHPAADLFPMMSDEELDALGADIKKNGLRRRVSFVVAGGGEHQLLDGRNRIEAIVRVSDLTVDLNKIADIHTEKCIGDPYAYVISSNIHRRHLTVEQRRELIAKVLKTEPGKSDRQIAETVKASPTTVGTVRKEMEATGQLSKLDSSVRKGADGKERKQPAKKPPTRAEIRARRKAKHEAARVRREAAAQRREIEIATGKAAAMEFAVELRDRIGAENFGWIAAQLTLIDQYELVDAISVLALDGESS